MNRYKIKLKNDYGKIIIETTASSKEQAIKQVLDYEHAPYSSLLEVKDCGKLY